jgi:hypothetical protein
MPEMSEHLCGSGKDPDAFDFYQSYLIGDQFDSGGNHRERRLNT